MKHRILIVEDSAAIAEVLADNLSYEGYQVQCLDDGDRAVKVASEFVPDLVILDIMLPGTDGFSICQALRQIQPVAIMILTARTQKDDRIRGLDLGADDYVTKPFHLEEVIARVRAVLRRTRPDVDQLRLGRLTIDFRNLRAWDDRGPVELTHQEFDLLHYLAARQGAVVHRDELLQRVWRYGATPLTRLVDRAIARLRRKIEPYPHHPRYIHTVHGEGYSLTPDGRPGFR